MKPILLGALLDTSIQPDIPNKVILGYSDGSQNYGGEGERVYFINSGLKMEDIKLLVDNNDGIISHIGDASLHWSAADRREYAKLLEDFSSHIGDKVIHITQEDRDNWDSKETEAGAQEKANVVQANLEVHAADLGIHTTKLERDRWNNTYTREETANMLSNAQSNSVWKQAVDTFDDLATTYPNAKKGWTCTALDTMTTYTYDGEAWVVAFINTMPLATDEINGLLSAKLHLKLSNIEEFANNYIHPDNVNCRHVTDLQIKKWDQKASTDLATIFKAGLMSSPDKDKLDTIERYANFYQHPDFHPADMIEETPERKFVTEEQIKTWSNPVGVMASETQDGAMSSKDFIKLAEIEEKANHYVHPVKHSSTDIAEDTLHRFVTDQQIADWTGKEDPTTSQARADQALQLAKEYSDGIKTSLLGGAGEAFDTLKELADALGSDKNFSTTIMTELSNKVGIDVYTKHITDFNTHLSTDDRLKLDSVELNANFYIHPQTHPANMIVTSPNYRFVTDGDISLWNSKAPGTIATPTQDGIMSKEYAAKLESISATGKVRSDFNETDPNADSFIFNKPTKLPADGGNADTVGGYTAEELRAANKSSSITIGSTSAGFSDKDVDFICDGTNDVQQITNALAALPSSGGLLLFREGEYIISSTLNIDIMNTTLQGCGNVVFKNNIVADNSIAVKVDAMNCTIKGIKFDGSKQSATGCSLYIDGNTNLITDCNFVNGSIGLRLSSGSYNKIIANDFNTVGRGIIVESVTKDCYGNIITNNSILDCDKEGILLMSSLDKKVSNTIINNNSIWNAYTGIRLTNEYMTPNTINTVINGNNIMRGTGRTDDYLYEQRTVYIEYASHTLVTGNMVRGRDVFDKTTDGTNKIDNNLAL